MSLIRQTAKALFAGVDLALPSPRGPRILIYHQVGASTGRQTDLAVSDFEWQLDWLADNREVVDIESAIRGWEEPDSDRLVVLSFDDGYADTYVNAYPHLLDRGIPFTLYVATSFIESCVQRDTMASLSWEQLQEMSKSGLLTLGAHTHTHRDLREVAYSEVEREVHTANRIIENRLGTIPLHFAYPWGYWSPQAHEVVSKHYRSAVLGAPVKRQVFDPYRIHRFPVQHSDGMRWFQARLASGLMAEERLRRWIRGYRGP